jgi:hypothetical protein
MEKPAAASWAIRNSVALSSSGAFGELPGEFPVAGPRLEDHAIQVDVGERRIVALVPRLTLRIDEVRPGRIELVDIAKPLPDHKCRAFVDLRRRCLSVQLERPLGRLAVEALTEEEAGARPHSERGGDESGRGVRQPLEQLDRCACGVGGSREVDGSGFPSNADQAADALNRLDGDCQRLLAEREGGRLPLPPVLDLGEPKECTRTQVSGRQHRPELLERLACASKVTCQEELFRELELQVVRRIGSRRSDSQRRLEELGRAVGRAALLSELCGGRELGNDVIVFAVATERKVARALLRIRDDRGEGAVRLATLGRRRCRVDRRRKEGMGELDAAGRRQAHEAGRLGGGKIVAADDSRVRSCERRRSKECGARRVRQCADSASYERVEALRNG